MSLCISLTIMIIILEPNWETYIYGYIVDQTQMKTSCRVPFDHKYGNMLDSGAVIVCTFGEWRLLIQKKSSSFMCGVKIRSSDV